MLICSVNTSVPSSLVVMVEVMFVVILAPINKRRSLRCRRAAKIVQIHVITITGPPTAGAIMYADLDVSSQ